MNQLVIESDGRRLRREQNREAVIDALLSLLRDEVYQPSTAQIADRAGLSPRSLFRYFDDARDLLKAAVTKEMARVLPLVEPGIEPAAPTAAKIEQIAQRRARLYEAVGPAGRALRAGALLHEAFAEQLARVRQFFRGQLSMLFEPELASADPGTLAAIDVMLSYESYDLLRHDHGLSVDATVRTLAGALTAQLAGCRARQP
ncbi:MAG TPA: TetR/AcrR family transcriptional regulator [Streptosporangiaceae bacterium]|jgi:AcrR family transcriptional regulator